MGEPLDIQPAVPGDIDGLTELFMACFDDDYFKTVFPPGGPGEAYIGKAWSNFIHSKELGIQEANVFVVKDAKGKISAGLLIWIVRPEDGGLWTWSRRWPAAVDGMDDAKLEEFFIDMETQHRAVMGGDPHIYLEIVLTHPSSQRQGLGSALVSHASKVADQGDHDMYLDSMGQVMSIYEREGYIHRMDVVKTSEHLYPMMRPRSSKRALS